MKKRGRTTTVTAKLWTLLSNAEVRQQRPRINDDHDVIWLRRKSPRVSLLVDSPGSSHEGPKTYCSLESEEQIEGSSQLVPARYKTLPPQLPSNFVTEYPS